MSIDPEALPYRPCVGVMLLNADQHVWIGRRIKKPHDETNAGKFVWQMPQGGIDDGEDAEQAALRELYEETGVSSVEIIAKLDGWLSYDLPTDLLGRALKGKYRGQKQKWFAMRFKGHESEVDISEKPEHKAEFDEWRWAEAKELPGLIVPFKREVYRQVVAKFSHLLG